MISLLLAVIYLSFVSLGLPDSLLGSSWPVIYPELNVPVSWSGIVFAIISVGTVISSLESDRMTRLLGAGKVTAISTAMTAVALFGFSLSTHFWMLCLWAVPYGLGAGSVDAALNNYVALHYESRHMSWLHCMWGLGASVGPYIMSMTIAATDSWHSGYRIIGWVQLAMCAAVFLSLPLWKSSRQIGENIASPKSLSLGEVFRLPGAKEIMLAFFCYCALEQTIGLWASSYLVIYKGIPEVTASAFGSLFFIGITVGRGINGFLTFKLQDAQLIHLGHGIVAFGILLLVLPLSGTISLVGLILIGLGCAPIYPCIIHSTPALFGKENSQAMVGVQMASAYVGICIMPPFFGLLASLVHVSILPLYLLIILVVEITMYRKVLKEASLHKNKRG